MFILEYREQNKASQEIIDRLQELSLAHKEVQTSAVNVISLKEGKTTINGVANIKAFLDDLSKELHQWYYCSC